MIYFIFEFVPEFIHWSLLWKDCSCFRRLILSLSWKSNDRGGLMFWTCLHATVLLAVKYSAELNKYILLVRVICEKYRFRGQSNVPRRWSGSGYLSLLSTGIFRKYSSLTGYICIKTLLMFNKFWKRVLIVTFNTYTNESLTMGLE